MDEVRAKTRKKNQIFFSPKDAFLQDLVALISEQNHQTMVLWAFDFAEETVRVLEGKYPHESRPRNALGASRLWASGAIKMPAAKREILHCHAFAKEITSNEDIALCHAIGQACGVVHANGHAMCYPVYDLSAYVHRFGIESCKEKIEERKQAYIEKIVYWEKNHVRFSGTWAAFMQKN